MPRLLSALVGDEEIAAYFRDDAELNAMLRFEVALAEAQAKVGLIPPEAAQAIMNAAASFKPDLGALAQSLRRDGVLGPGFVAQLRQTVAAPHQVYLHFGATSQDVVDTSLVLRLRHVIAAVQKRLQHLTEALERMRIHQGATPLIAQT